MTDFLGEPDVAPRAADDAARPLRRVAWGAWGLGVAAVAGAAAIGRDGLPSWSSDGFAGRLGLWGVLLAAAAAPAWRLARAGDRTAAVRALWASPVLCVLAAARADSAIIAALAAGSVASLLVGLALEQSVAARERAGRALRDRVLPGDTEPGARRRIRAAAGLVLPALALAVLLAPVTTCTPGGGGTGSGVGRGRRASGSGDASGAGGTGVVVDPSSSADGLSALTRTILLEVTPTRDDRPVGDQGAMYLRGLPLIDIDADGRWMEETALPPRVADRDDGRTDGWCVLGDRPDAAAELGLSVRQLRLDHASSGLLLVHAPRGTAAINLPRVRHAPDGPILADAVGDATLDYRLVTTHPVHTPAPNGTTRARVRDERSLALPAGRATVDRLAATARVVAEGTTSDVSKIRAVIRHLRAGYAYRGLVGGLDDAAALDVFVAERAGTCVQFAEAAAFMLRSLGIPSRVGTGFLVREWDDERSLYVARGRDYHAWLEVDFDDLGWVIFEATPSVPDDADRAGLGEGGEGRIESRGLGAFVRGLRGAAGEAGTWGWLALSVVLLAGALAWYARRGRALEFDFVHDPVAAPSGVPAWDLLLAALARRGLRRRPSQTAVEFAGEVGRTEGGRMAAFVDLTRRQQAARFGGHPLTGDDTRAIDAFRATL